MTAAGCSARPFRNPSVPRCFAALMLALLFPRNTPAQQTDAPVALTEAEVVARVLARAPLHDAIEGNVVIEEGRGLAAKAYPNPQLSYMREQTFGSFGTAEDYLSIAQIFDLGNRRGLYGEAGDARARAARREGESSRLLIAADARLRFYETLYRQARAVALEAWLVRIEDALAIVTRREQRGDAAKYDRRRLERERTVATGRVKMERAALERARAGLQALLATGAGGGRLDVTGTLLPDSDPAALPSLRAASRARPDLLGLDLRIEAAAREQTAASRWWAPDLRLEGGWKGVDLGRQGRTDGFLLAASLSLPFWDQWAGLSRMAEGQARATRGRRALLEGELLGTVDGARAEAAGLRHAAAEFREQATVISADLVRIASAGYEGGELGLLELLDAYRGAADDALTALDMELAARRARIELDRLTGAGLP